MWYYGRCGRIRARARDIGTAESCARESSSHAARTYTVQRLTLSGTSAANAIVFNTPSAMNASHGVQSSALHVLFITIVVYRRAPDPGIFLVTRAARFEQYGVLSTAVLRIRSRGNPTSRRSTYPAHGHLPRPATVEGARRAASIVVRYASRLACPETGWHDTPVVTYAEPRGGVEYGCDWKLSGARLVLR